MKILFLSFTFGDIGVAMVTNLTSQLQQNFTLRRAAGSFEIAFTKCGNFISICKIDRTLHNRIGILISSFRANNILAMQLIELFEPQKEVKNEPEL